MQTARMRQTASLRRRTLDCLHAQQVQIMQVGVWGARTHQWILWTDDSSITNRGVIARPSNVAGMDKHCLNLKFQTASEMSRSWQVVDSFIVQWERSECRINSKEVLVIFIVVRSQSFGGFKSLCTPRNHRPKQHCESQRESQRASVRASKPA